MRTYRTVISSILSNLELDPEHQLIQEDEDCCPICLEELDKYNVTSMRFMCCGKSICRSCDPKERFKNCPMCRQEMTQTLPLIRKNVKIGRAWAQFNLAHYFDSSAYSSSDPSIKKNDSEAFRLYLLSSKQGYRSAQFSLGLMYEEGRGVQKSIKDAVYWFTLAANQGHLKAQNFLGGIINSTRGPDAILLYKNAAENGLPSAQYNYALSFYYEKNPDLQKAIFWFKKAALQNYHDSQYRISSILLHLNLDIPTAMYWLRKAAGSGDVKSIKLLALQEIKIASKCAACLKNLDGKGKKCTKCKSVYYCNKICQGNDWKLKHKKECVDVITE